MTNNPFDQAADVINDLRIQMVFRIKFIYLSFPVFENPLMPIMQDTPLTPTSLTYLELTQKCAAQVQGGNFSNLTNNKN